MLGRHPGRARRASVEIPLWGGAHRQRDCPMVCARLARCALGAALILVLPVRAGAQAYVSLGGGAQFPTGQYADRLATGWIVSGRIGFPVGPEGLSLGVEGFFGRNNYDRNSNLGEGLGGALLFAAFRFGDRTRTRPYLFAGLGGGGQGTGELIVSWFPAYSLGAGIRGPTPKVGFFAETRYTRNPDFSFVEVLAGITIPLGRAE